MPRGERPRGLELGVMLLLHEILNVGYTNIPTVTLATIIAQALLYTRIINVPWRRYDVCISGHSVLKQGDYKRLLLLTVEHGDDMHLYYNMISFLIKGRSLENRYGSPNFAFLLLILTTLTSLAYVALAKLAVNLLNDYYYMNTCAIGFSGVIFALKVLCSYETPPETTYVGGMAVQSRYAPWCELILIHLLVPRASFMGHLAGIVAGLLYACTSLGEIIDKVVTSLTGDRMNHHPSFRRNYII